MTADFLKFVQTSSRDIAVGGNDTESLQSPFGSRQKPKGDHVPHRGNLPVELTWVPADWTGTVPLRHGGLNNRCCARNQEKKCLASRGGVKSKGWSFLA